MIVSSRTPEGVPNHCPLCGALVAVEPTRPAGDAPCPNCGRLLWFLQLNSEPRFFAVPDSEGEPWQVPEEVIRIFCERLDTSTDQIDSLDFAELMMNLEAAFNITIPLDEMAQIRTIGDLLDYLERMEREE